MFPQNSQYDWSDIIPLKQFDGPQKILNLKYQEEYEIIMDYFRAIIQSQEKSQRAMELAGLAIQHLAGNFTAWFLRRVCITELYKNENEKLNKLLEEIDFLNFNFKENEKCYQIWEHRRWCIESINQPLNEIEFINSILQKDNKNYHAWSYRKFLVERFKLFDDEIKQIEMFLQEDIRNNSAWTQKFYVMSTNFIQNSDDLSSEINQCISLINKCPDNESAWNYLNGWFQCYEFKMFKQNKEQLSNLNLNKRIYYDYQDFPQVEKFCREFNLTEDACRFSYYTLINILILQKNKKSIQEAFQVYNQYIYIIKMQIQLIQLH